MNLCTIGKVAVVLDGQAGDEAPGRAIGAALAAQCAPAPAVREISQTSSDVSAIENPTTGQPVARGDELLVVAGGYYFQHAANYAETVQHVAPVYAYSDGATIAQYRAQGSDQVLASFSLVEDPSHYFFVIQFMQDPKSGSLILNAQGFWQGSTAIAASYFSEQMLPTLATFTKSWYLYEWTDANADLKAQASEVVLKRSGP